MNDSKKNLTEEELKLIKEEELFMEEVYSNPEVAGAEVPSDLHDKVFAEIRLREAKKAAELAEERRLAEEQELIEYKRRYKKAVNRQKWLVLAAVLIMAMAFGMVSIGGPEKIFEKINWMIAGREQVNVDSKHEDIVPRTSMSEEEAYQEIEDTFGFVPVGLGYVPKGVKFVEAQIGEEIQFINMVYGEEDMAKITYVIQPNYQVGSLGKDVEDEFEEEYVKQNENAAIYIREYLVDKTEERWSVQFEYQKVSYSITIMDTSQEEVEKIVDGLYFPIK